MAAAQDQTQWKIKENEKGDIKFNLYRSYLYPTNPHPPIAFYGTDLEGVKSYTTDEPIFHRWGNIELKLVDLDNSLDAMYDLYDKLNKNEKSVFNDCFFLLPDDNHKVTGYRVSDNKERDIQFFNILKRELEDRFVKGELKERFVGSYTQKGKTVEHGLGLSHSEIVIWNENTIKNLNPLSELNPEEKLEQKLEKKPKGKIVYDYENDEYTVKSKDENEPTNNNPYYQALDIKDESGKFWFNYIEKMQGKRKKGVEQ